jgi:anti-sigma factor RsiW
MRRQHAITLFVFPAEASALSSALSAERNGYHVTSWRDASFISIATSDLGRPEFDDFVKLARGDIIR